MSEEEKNDDLEELNGPLMSEDLEALAPAVFEACNRYNNETRLTKIDLDAGAYDAMFLLIDNPEQIGAALRCIPNEHPGAPDVRAALVEFWIEYAR